MGWNEIIFCIALIVVLLFVAILYATRQILALRQMRQAEEMALEDRSYLLSRARRRLITSVLMFVLGIMLTGYLIYLGEPAGRLAQQREAQEQQGDNTPLDPEQRLFARDLAMFWIVFLLILLTVVFLAARDFWATRRYGLVQHRKIVADRRAMIEREVSRLRQERNGHF